MPASASGRNISRKNVNSHRGRWLKMATRAADAGGKHFRIVGYGNIGSMVGLPGKDSYRDCRTLQRWL
jgi:phosphoglycerate dehydrogenase-like enzyme